MPGTVFNRREIKYIIDDRIYQILNNRLADYMAADTYNRDRETYRVLNLYYDTTDSHLIRTSQCKPVFKEKLRLRSYGIPRPDSQVYLEIKKKLDGTVFKRRTAIRLDAAKRFIETAILPEPTPGQNQQVLREIQYLLTIQELKPRLVLAYARRAYFALSEHNLRISFDSDIVCRRYDLSLDAGDYGQPLLQPGQSILEIKAAGSMPLWLTRLLSEYSLLPHSFSKYGAEYRQMILAKISGNEENTACSTPSLVPPPVQRKQRSRQATS